MKAWLLKFTGFVVQWGGLLVGVMYLHQAYSIYEFPTAARGISLPAFLYLNFMQLNMFIYACLRGDTRMKAGFGSAVVGTTAVTIVTLYFR